jgi:CBS domain-containing protein
MSAKARDVMQEDMVTVSPDLPLLDAHQLFVSEEIHGAPVVDDQGALVGVISSADLLRAVAEEHGAARVEANYLRDLVEFSSPDWIAQPEDFQDRLRELRVSDAMTTEVVQVSPDASLEEVAGALCDNRVHRVVVVESGIAVGVISTFDLVNQMRHAAAEKRRAS